LTVTNEFRLRGRRPWVDKTPAAPHGGIARLGEITEEISLPAPFALQKFELRFDPGVEADKKHALLIAVLVGNAAPDDAVTSRLFVARVDPARMRRKGAFFPLWIITIVESVYVRGSLRIIDSKGGPIAAAPTDRAIREFALPQGFFERVDILLDLAEHHIRAVVA
jgi:hypothetical protein